ncbi:hypothetical protein L915_03285, partial [Phytophthora nicotianae]
DFFTKTRRAAYTGTVEYCPHSVILGHHPVRLI